MAKKYLKKFLLPTPANRKVQMKITLKCYHVPVRMAKGKRTMQSDEGGTVGKEDFAGFLSDYRLG